MDSEKIGRYEIKSELGRGGMATVYKAYDPRFEREVAVKVLPREMLHDTQFRVRFEREAKMIALLEHPAIVPVYDVGEEDGQPYFVMRYMIGGSLADRIKKGPLALTEAARLMSKLAPALDEAHQKGIIHRDLKPGNILFDRVGEPYVSDFGIAKMTQSQGATVTGGAIIGTPAYMSPEQAQGEKVDGRSDIYALGVIVYEMLTGHQPYEADTPMVVVVKHITEPIPHILDANPNLPADIEAVIEKAMAKSPNKRYATAADFAKDLAFVARGESPTIMNKVDARPITGSPEAKTVVSDSKTFQQPKTPEAKNTPSGGGISSRLLISIGVVAAILIVGVVGVFSMSALIAPAVPTETPVPTALPATDIPPATETSVPTETPTLEPTPTATLEPITPSPTVALAGPVIGGADKIAFLANKEIWIMNLDGTDLKQLTSDKAPKSDLQWSPDGKSVFFISGKTVFGLNIDTGVQDIVMAFPYAQKLSAFRLSPNNKLVAISMNNEMFVVNFDLPTFQSLRTWKKSDLLAIKGCIRPVGNTRTAALVKDFRWSNDSKKLAWLFSGALPNTQGAVDIVDVVDISTCDATKIKLIDEFPGLRFKLPEYDSRFPILTSYDWNGESFMVMNTYIRNEGWGNMYVYNLELHRNQQIFPMGDGKCCYRDARWSPDGLYLLFGYQDSTNIQVYYVPYTSIDLKVTDLQPIPIPDYFFKDLAEAPEFALRPAAPPAP